MCVIEHIYKEYCVCEFDESLANMHYGTPLTSFYSPTQILSIAYEQTP